MLPPCCMGVAVDTNADGGSGGVRAARDRSWEVSHTSEHVGVPKAHGSSHVHGPRLAPPGRRALVRLYAWWTPAARCRRQSGRGAHQRVMVLRGRPRRQGVRAVLGGLVVLVKGGVRGTPAATVLINTPHFLDQFFLFLRWLGTHTLFWAEFTKHLDTTRDTTIRD